ncbi:zinc-binding dehydrogenase [Streptomyces muensis]|uniref:2-deoxy-scyllo-inosamine dehydrogenase n=1 Tax=Streptomyces muensis TaxID=1077944 RepID=A0A9X1PRT7_STRM4|nr:zinc-binding dehydrogenase [Streptomyces muensis]MCF1592337.1 zinc-binding dehydrogenase [Streptomyces muensis]
MQTFKAVVYQGGSASLEPVKLTLDALAATQIRVRITASGVCHTDRHVLSGAIPVEPPLILGHEAVGVVEEVGSEVHVLKRGDTVVLLTNPGCGHCWYCVRGEGQNCLDAESIRGAARSRTVDGLRVPGFVGLGTFAEQIVVDQAAAVRIESSLPSEQLALVGCGVLTGAGAVLTSPVRAGSSVAVVGCGGVGLAAIQAAKAVGATTVIAVDPLESKRAAALALGATHAIDPTAENHAESVRAHTGGRGVDVAFEAVGSSATIAQTFRATRVGGTTIVLGLPTPGDPVGLDATEFVFGSKALVGSVAGGGDPRRLIPVIVGWAEDGRIDLAGMVTRRIGLEDVQEAMDAMDRGEGIRSVIVF